MNIHALVLFEMHSHENHNENHNENHEKEKGAESQKKCLREDFEHLIIDV